MDFAEFSVMYGAEHDISHTLNAGRWAIVADGRVVEIRLLDPVGFLPPSIYRDVGFRPEVDVGWIERDGDFFPPPSITSAQEA